MLVSPGEARQRADTFLLVGDRPARSLAGSADFLLLRCRRTSSEDAAVAADPGAVEPRARWPALAEVTLVRSCDGGASRPACRAPRARQRPARSPHDFDRVRDRRARRAAEGRDASASRSGRPDELDALAIEMLAGLIKDLNADTRWSGLSVAADASAVGAAMASRLDDRAVRCASASRAAGRSTIPGATMRRRLVEVRRSGRGRLDLRLRRAAAGLARRRAEPSCSRDSRHRRRRPERHRDPGRAAGPRPRRDPLRSHRRARSSRRRPQAPSAAADRRRRARPASPTRLAAP